MTQPHPLRFLIIVLISICFKQLSDALILECSGDDILNFFSSRGSSEAELWNGAEYTWQRPRDQNSLKVKVFESLRLYSKEALEAFNREQDLREFLRGLGVTPYIECSYDRSYTLYMREDHPGTNLNAYLAIAENWQEKMVDLAINMASVLDALHSNGVIAFSMDLKDWIVSDRGGVILDNLSHSRLTNSVPISSMTLLPETAECKTCYTFKSDVFLLGKLFQQMVLSIPQNEIQLAGERNDFMAIVNQMNQSSPEDRPTMKQVISSFRQFL